MGVRADEHEEEEGYDIYLRVNYDNHDDYLRAVLSDANYFSQVGRSVLFVRR